MIGDIISGIGSLVGGYMNSEANREAAAVQERNAIRNIEMQREFAQSGIQWKAEDARKAGIHPLYAMGAAGASFAPVSVAGIPNTSMGDALSKSSQHIGRAVQAAQTRDDQAVAISRQAQQLQLTNAGLQNELLAAQVAKAKQELVVSPAMPSLNARYGIEGQPATTFSERFGSWPKTSWEEKNERVSREPGAPHREAFSVADVGHANTAGGGYSAIPSKDVQERIEDNWLQQIMWMYRNNILPSIGFNESPPNVPVPKGYDAWRYHPIHQEYRPHKRGWLGLHY